MRKPIMAGNWKMHKTVLDATRFAKEVNERIPAAAKMDTVICAPAIVLHRLAEVTIESDLKLGAQNMHWEEKGAYTGEISPLQIKDIGASYVIIGHSERREQFGETDETVNKKVQAAFRHGLIPIICVGETLQEREANETEVVVQRQVEKAFAELSREQARQAVIAYEPVWAIGTDRSASPDDANAVCEHIRQVMDGLFSKEVAAAIRIQYGGSVNVNNIAEISSQPHIDGALVGGASLQAASFLQLLEAVQHG